MKHNHYWKHRSSVKNGNYLDRDMYHNTFDCHCGFRLDFMTLDKPQKEYQ